MNQRAQLIKTAIMVELSKAGISLDNLEESLSIKKESVDGLYDISKVPEGIGHLLNIIGGATVGTGMALGVGGYGAYLQNEDSTDRIVKKMREQQQYIDATKRLKSDMQDPIKL